ncbi:MAG: hypothetical protein KC492_02380 [Myxococcales bacterium]|nr:hypothetical protein [Myxococcales bacterium]
MLGRLWLACAGVGLVASGCCSEPKTQAKVSDGWVVVSGIQGSSFVDHPTATEGQPLSTSTQGQNCLTDRELGSAFGETCAHESENPASGQPDSGDLQPGIPTATNEVRWYCRGELTVRVVFQRCSKDGGTSNGVTPVEIAVKTHKN